GRTATRSAARPSARRPTSALPGLGKGGLVGAGDLDVARLVAESGEGHGDGAGREERTELVGPLHHGDAGAVGHLLDAEAGELGETLRPVGVEMVDGQATPVLVDEHERRARHPRRDAEAAAEALQEARLAGAERADARHHRPRSEPRAQRLAEGLGLLGRARAKPPRGHQRAAGGLMAWAMASTRSPAISPSWPRAAAARSPARPWRKHAATSASVASRPRARNAPAIPVSTSPDPPLAIPGLPVGLMNARPSEPATIVDAPLSARPPRWRGAKSRAVSIRSACPAGTVVPSILAISPGWGVSTRGPAARSSTSRWPASAVRASASTTIGRSTLRTS